MMDSLLVRIPSAISLQFRQTRLQTRQQDGYDKDYLTAIRANDGYFTLKIFQRCQVIFCTAANRSIVIDTGSYLRYSAK